MSGRAGALRRLALAVAVAACLACLAWPGAARSAESVADVGVTWDSGEVQASHDELVDAYLAGGEDGPGIAVVTSYGGEVDIERYSGKVAPGSSTAVGAQTAFEWGRCSDLVVWVCVMQLVEAGMLDLDDAVAGLLPAGVSLPEGYARLDVVDLMNHTTGLDVAMVGSRSSLPDGIRSVAPAFGLFSVVGEFEPGSVVAYTPYDALLGAAVVESVSGMAFVDYVEKNVFDRLGMDGTYIMVGGSPTRLAQQVEGPVQSLMLAKGTAGPMSVSSPQSSSSSVFGCFGPVGDLLKLANGAMCVEGQPAAFDLAETADAFFDVTRIYASLGVARIAHGMFAFPLSPGVLGMWATTSSGFSAAVYMDRAQEWAVVVAVNESGRADLVQGIPRALVGWSDPVSANATSPENSVWKGTYQNASSPSHGPSKVLTALGRTTVSVNGDGVLTFNGLTATSLGAGVYSADTAIDQDVYRFHVSLQRGSEFSRASSDYYVVPRSTLAVEFTLLGLFAIAHVGCLCYLVAGAVAWARAKMRPRRAVFQPAVLYLAASSVAAGAVAVYAVVRIDDGLASSTLDALLALEWVYVALAVVVAVWLGVTRWRDTVWTLRQNLACVAVLLAALATVLNLVYWEMLP